MTRKRARRTDCRERQRRERKSKGERGGRGTNPGRIRGRECHRPRERTRSWFGRLGTLRLGSRRRGLKTLQEETTTTPDRHFRGSWTLVLRDLTSSSYSHQSQIRSSPLSSGTPSVSHFWEVRQVTDSHVYTRTHTDVRVRVYVYLRDGTSDLPRHTH